MSLSRTDQTCLVATLLLFTASMSTGAQGMSQEEMQQMMQQGAAAQKCFADIDQSAMQQLDAKGRQMEAEIKALCAEGKRDEAMSAAMKYGGEIRDDPQLQAIRKCSEMMQGMMAQMPKPYMPPEPGEDGKGGHVCDDM